MGEGRGRRGGGGRNGEEEEGGEGIRSPSQHSRAQRSHTAAEDLNSRAWSWENILGLALLLSSGRPQSSTRGWEESLPAPAPREERAALVPGALGPLPERHQAPRRRGGLLPRTHPLLTFRVGVYSVGFWGASLALRLSGNFCQIKPTCLPQHVKKRGSTYFWISKKLHVTLGRL